MAARDTTASLIASSMYELACNPDVQNMVREEITEYIGQDDSVSFQDIKNLKVLRAVLNETLRYFLAAAPPSEVAMRPDMSCPTECIRQSRPIAAFQSTTMLR
jgi:cytochrome P450